MGKLLGKTAVTRKLAKDLNINPITINYLIDQYSGGVGDVLLPKLTPQAENNAVLNKFTTSSTMKNKYPSEYYEKLNELKADAGKSNATDEDKVAYKFLNSVNKDMAEMYKAQQDAQISKTGDEYKRENVQGIQRNINRTAKEQLQDLESLKIQGNTATVGDTVYIKNNKGEWSELEKELPKGLPTGTYADYKKSLDEAKDKYKNKTGNSMTEKEQNQLLDSKNYTDKQKLLLYSATTGSDDKTYQTLEVFGDGVVSDSYWDYKLKSQDDYFTNKDKDTGKTYENRKKNRLMNFLAESDMTEVEKNYIKVKEGYVKSLTSAQKRELREMLEDNMDAIDASTYESMMKKLK